MAVSKVAYDGHTLIDLTGDTAVEADVASGKTFHKADGTIGVGIASGGGGTVNLQNKTVNLGSSSPAAVSADDGYDGLGQVSFNVSGITASNIKSGASVCGVAGTYAGTIDLDVREMSISSVARTVTLGWRPDKIVVSYEVHAGLTGDDPYYDQVSVTLSDTGSIVPGSDTVTFTSTGYTIQFDGSYWNSDPDYEFDSGYVTITAIRGDGSPTFGRTITISITENGSDNNYEIYYRGFDASNNVVWKTQGFNVESGHTVSHAITVVPNLTISGNPSDPRNFLRDGFFLNITDGTVVGTVTGATYRFYVDDGEGGTGTTSDYFTIDSNTITINMNP